MTYPDTDSFWRAHPLPSFPSSGFPDQVDVVVVGGGITGLTAAYLLKRAGKRVAVFERERIGAGETGNTSAHLTQVTDLRLSQIEKDFGSAAARQVWQGSAVAIDLIESIAARHNIDCGFTRVSNYLCAPFDGNETRSAELREEANTAASLGFSAEYQERGPITGKPAVEYPNQALFHPLDYLGGLALAVNGDGSFVFEHAEVSEVLQDPLVVTVNGESIACTDVVIATHVPIVGSKSLPGATLFQTKIYPHSSYVVGAQVDNSVAPGLYSDSSEPYWFLRVHSQQSGRYAILGGMDHKTGQEDDPASRFARLEAMMELLIPGAQIDFRWTGQVIETDDGLPYAGQNAPHQYIATGFAGNGLTLGTLSALLIHDLITGHENPLQQTFDPSRKARSLGAVGEYLRENIDFPAYLLADWLRPRSGSVDDIAPGDGAIVKIDGKRVACHRTPSGELRKVSAVCTHMGCLVRWNNADTTWDCPCHGSRFTTDGLVIGGPAEMPLEKIE